LFAAYLSTIAGASLGKVVEILEAKGVSSPRGNPKWTRSAIDKLLGNSKHIPIIGMRKYMDSFIDEKDAPLSRMV